MSHTVAVDVIGVSKRFRLYHEKYHSFKERVLHAGRNPYENFWALSDVNLSVAEGETFGLVGRNGSGKSTLLKCIAGILQPTAGEVVVRGQLAALLELGAGFQPELSGRDNIFLNASLLGLSRRDVEQRFDEIVAFAELEQFIDNQIKYYSSGMTVRLGFAIAVNVEPDVFVVDEVLAVGDENFQQKCLGRIHEFQEEGRTIVFVTHSAGLVTDICDRAAVLDSGRLLGVAGAEEAIGLYHKHLADLAAGQPAEVPELALEAAAVGQGGAPRQGTPFDVVAIDLEHPGSGTRQHVLPGEPVTVRIAYHASVDLPDLVVGVELLDQDGTLLHATDTAAGGAPMAVSAGSGHLTITFDSMPLLDGRYQVRMRPMVSGNGQLDLGVHEATFEVANPGRAQGKVALELRAEVKASA